MKRLMHAPMSFFDTTVSDAGDFGRMNSYAFSRSLWDAS